MDISALIPKSVLNWFFSNALLILIAAVVLAIILTVGVKRFSERLEDRLRDEEDIKDDDDRE
ncbi:MAG: hypothetical protein IKO47_04980 [Ruminococcus sp.]|nr:hypothetical protein [Ruminococcus sp.]